MRSNYYHFNPQRVSSHPYSRSAIFPTVSFTAHSALWLVTQHSARSSLHNTSHKAVHSILLVAQHLSRALHNIRNDSSEGNCCQPASIYFVLEGISSAHNTIDTFKLDKFCSMRRTRLILAVIVTADVMTRYYYRFSNFFFSLWFSGSSGSSGSLVLWFFWFCWFSGSSGSSGSLVLWFFWFSGSLVLLVLSFFGSSCSAGSLVLWFVWFCWFSGSSGSLVLWFFWFSGSLVLLVLSFFGSSGSACSLVLLPWSQRFFLIFLRMREP